MPVWYKIEAEHTAHTLEITMNWRKAWLQEAKRLLGVTRITELKSTHVIWAGESQLDGTPIMLVACCNKVQSRNSKTGDMIQFAIMRTDMNPGKAYDQGLDGAVCPEDCNHRSRARGGDHTCYVDKHRLSAAYEQAIAALQRGDIGVPEGFYRGARCRFGNEGDPSAVPFYIWDEIAADALGFTGYTANWCHLDPEWSRLFMASVSTPADAMRARSKGWRWFASSARADHDAEFSAMGRECHADAHGLTCTQCHGCDGTSRGASRPSFWLKYHGATGAKHRRVLNVDYRKH